MLSAIFHIRPDQAGAFFFGSFQGVFDGFDLRAYENNYVRGRA